MPARRSEGADRAVAGMKDKDTCTRPMRQFDPTKPALLHDALNDKVITWTAAADEVARFREARWHCEEVLDLDGLMIDGWGEVLGG